MATNSEPSSYIDYETFLSPSFTPTTFANTLVTSTNNASDLTVDLTTPLSRVLFDLQEIDTHIHDITTKSALPLLQHTKTQSVAADRLVQQVDSQIQTLTESYRRLEREVIERHAVAEEVRLAASRLWVTVKIGRAVARALLLGRSLERDMAEAMKTAPGTGVVNQASVVEDHAALVRATYTLQTLRVLFNASGRDEDGEHLSRINVLNTLRTDLLTTSEQRLKNRAQQIIREFSLSSLTQAASASAAVTASTNGTQQASATTLPPQTNHETRSRTISALQTLYLLSPPQTTAIDTSFQPTLLLNALTTYLQTSLTSSIASLTRALSSLPTLPRALTETSARCQNITALEQLLASTPPTLKHPLLEAHNCRLTENLLVAPPNLLQPLLAALDTASLPSYFWRSLSSGLAPRVAEILAKGGVAARSLRGAKERVRALLREAVISGVEGARRDEAEGGMNWEREVAVFVGSVLGALGR